MGFFHDQIKPFDACGALFGVVMRKLVAQYGSGAKSFCGLDGAVLMETFVEFERHRGTCYRAANWINIGQTAGRGKKSASHRQLIPVKDIWLYPLRKNFATALCQ